MYMTVDQRSREDAISVTIHIAIVLAAGAVACVVCATAQESRNALTTCEDKYRPQTPTALLYTVDERLLN